jgi:putative nucleotidyltransferase with HDIG domain
VANIQGRVLQDQILLVHGHEESRFDIREALGQRFCYNEIHIDDLASSSIAPPQAVILDLAPSHFADPSQLRKVMARLSSPQTSFAFLIDDVSRATVVRSHAMGAEFIVPRPLHAETVQTTLQRMLNKSRANIWTKHFAAEAPGLNAGTQALEGIFQLAATGSEVSPAELYAQGDVLIDTLGTSGLGRWIEAVKAHHSQTFRHCLLVTGVAVSFGKHLQLRHQDMQRLALGGMLHDIGKAVIPLEILEKPAPLDKSELVIMREHPDVGRKILLEQGQFNPEMIDIVAHHHECLDGSGYPDALHGSKISDIVRIMTISDIFAALIEERPYKSPMSNENALLILQGMKGKVDGDLLRAFEPLAMRTKLAA